MKVVIAPDKYRGSLTAAEAARALARGVSSVVPDAEIDEVPLADGGEGTTEALVSATGGRLLEVEVTGPLGEPVLARFGMLGDGTTAVLEMALASGLSLVPPALRDPSVTTTRGTGELLLAAIASGARKVILGIGGSATNDGGAGLAQALGYRLLDASGNEVGPGGGPVGRVARIDASGRTEALREVTVEVACDVENPLCGPNGASAIYGPQKGADPAMVARLDANLGSFARVIESDLGKAIRDIPGAGAAGGLGAGLVAFADARLTPGITLVIQAVGLKARLADADLCLTGEGAIDISSAAGKTAAGVGRLARALGCPAIAIGGSLGPGAEALLGEGIDAIFSLCTGPMTLEAAVSRAPELLERVSAQVVRAFLAGRPSIRNEAAR